MNNKRTDKRPDGHELWLSCHYHDYATYIEKPYVLGPHASEAQYNDPKHLMFTLSRYKFCAKMLSGKRNLLEIGCGDSTGLDLVMHEVQPATYTGVDFDHQIIEDNRKRFERYANVEFFELDMAKSKLPGRYDAVFSNDVIEHVYREDERDFMGNIVKALEKEAVFIMGTPNASAEQHTAAKNKVAHVNLKDAASLRSLISKYFHNVFIFSMNDEVVHRGYSPMAHYLFAMGVGVK
ncbi:MAG: class I SAM-dependent methyltransferase [Phycisphaerae bacterium]|nr:class I SAM-dependent methyltransferase [Phycisphaerae bacterium]